MYNSILEAVYQHSKTKKDKLAVADTENKYTYS